MINLNNNDTLKNIDREQLIEFIKNFYLTYRQSLNIKTDATFGYELEYEEKTITPPQGRCYEGFPTFLLCTELQKQGIKYLFSDDQTVAVGGEVITDILKDNIETWEQLDKICSIVRTFGYEGESCGGHFHIGMQSFKDLNSVKKFIKLWSKYENVLYRFYYGQYRNNRPAIRRFAMSIRNVYKVNVYKSLEEIKNATIDRYYCVNFKNAKNFELGDKNTIEIRCPNASLNPIILQNNVNVILKMIEKCNEDDFDIEEESSKEFEYTDVYSYEKFDYDHAFEFADLVFDNNLDKLYFLRQYFKDFVVRDNKSVLLNPSKVFTK